jgi:hypothetical protein
VRHEKPISYLETEGKTFIKRFLCTALTLKKSFRATINPARPVAKGLFLWKKASLAFQMIQNNTTFY